MDILISAHAMDEIIRRKLNLETIDYVLRNPQQVISVTPERKIYQSIIELNNKNYLLRLVVDLGDPDILVTTYRTSKIKKYWRNL